MKLAFEPSTTVTKLSALTHKDVRNVENVWNIFLPTQHQATLDKCRPFTLRPTWMWEVSRLHDYMDIGGTRPRMDEGRIMQEQLSRAKQGENHEMMAFKRETLRSNWPFNKDVIARAEDVNLYLSHGMNLTAFGLFIFPMFVRSLLATKSQA